MADSFVLSEKDLARIVTLVNTHIARRINTVGRIGELRVDIQETFTPEVYVARTPYGGIPGMELVCGTGTCTEDDYEIHDKPGYADCVVRRVMTEGEEDITDNVPSMITTPIESKRVYNISTTDIPQFTNILAVRDKYGNYIAVPSSTTTQSDPAPAETECEGWGWVAGLQDDDCLLISLEDAQGKCTCASGMNSITVRSNDGEIWDQFSTVPFPSMITFCDRDYYITFERNGCGPPCLKLTEVTCCGTGTPPDTLDVIIQYDGDEYVGTLNRNGFGGWSNTLTRNSPAYSKETGGDDSWTVPADGTYRVVCIGPSAPTAIPSGGEGAGGSGGGAYAESNVILTSGSMMSIHVGSGISSADHTVFNATQVKAAAGSSSVGTTGGTGGPAADSIGTIKFSGGNGGTSTGGVGGGGGGSAGRLGNGFNGAPTTPDSPGLGGPGGGTNGSAGGTVGNPGTAGINPGGGSGGSGDGSITTQSGGDGAIRIYAIESTGLMVFVYCLDETWYITVKRYDETEYTTLELTGSEDYISGTSSGSPVEFDAYVENPCAEASVDPPITYEAAYACGGCNYSIFSIGDICTGTRDPLGPCYNVAKIRVEWVSCYIDPPAPSSNCLFVEGVTPTLELDTWYEYTFTEAGDYYFYSGSLGEVNLYLESNITASDGITTKMAPTCFLDTGSSTTGGCSTMNPGFGGTTSMKILFEVTTVPFTVRFRISLTPCS